MSCISITSLYDVLKTENDSLIEAFSKINGFDLKEQEKHDFICLAEQLIKHGRTEQLMGYYIGQKTQSGVCEEFDLLRFSRNSILNIEIKNKWPYRREKCLEQLLSHRNILRLLIPNVTCYTYIVSSDELFDLNDDELKPTDFHKMMDSVVPDYIEENLLEKADLSAMLVSPYSEPQRFINHEYVLTQQQEEIKRKILSEDNEYSVIKGRAGTGKSLLLMDVAREYREKGKSVIVFLCRNYNSKSQLSNALDIRIEEIKALATMVDDDSIDDYDVVLFDEAQRIRSEQLNKILSLSLQDWKIVFSLDPIQTLNKQELASKISEQICNLESANVHELSNRIRANEAIDLFSQRLVHLNCKKWHPTNFSCIHLSFFDDEEKCKVYMRQLHKDKDAVIIEPTPYTTKTTRTEKRKKRLSYSRDPHSVLGEEFDHVVVLLDEYINYVEKDGERLIESSYPDYYPYDMNHCIYEAITRAKKTLEIIVLKNRDLFVSISGILML